MSSPIAGDGDGAPPHPPEPVPAGESTTQTQIDTDPSTSSPSGASPSHLTCAECSCSIPFHSFSSHLSTHWSQRYETLQHDWKESKLQIQHMEEERQNIEHERSNIAQRLLQAEQSHSTIEQRLNKSEYECQDMTSRLLKVEEERSAALETAASLASEKHALERETEELRLKLAKVATTTAPDHGSSESHTPKLPSTPKTPSFGGGAAVAAIPVLSTSELSSLSLAFFPELEDLLGSIPPASSKHVYTAASVYLYDSFHCRSIAHSTDFHALTAYQFIHISHWKTFVRWIGWLHILLGFIEPPSSLMVDGVRYGPNHTESGAIELVFLFIYTFHAWKQWQAYGPGPKGYWRSPWRTAKLFVLGACFIDVIVSMARNTDSPAIHLSQILRIFFVLEQSGRMRQLCSCIFKSLPQIVSIMFLCLIHVFVFGVIGFLFIRPLEEYSSLHPEDSKLYFDTLGHSFLSTFILLTSENFPEVMLPSYRKHWFVCVYFVAAIIIGLYGLLQLTTAVVFSTFQLHTKSKLNRALHYRERALEASFTLLSEYTCGDGFLSLETWTKLLQYLRPDWNETQAEILFRAATMTTTTTTTNVEEDEKKMNHTPITTTPRKQLSKNAINIDDDDGDDDAGEEKKVQSPPPAPAMMSFLQFEQIVRFTQKSFQFVTESMTPTSSAADIVDDSYHNLSVSSPIHSPTNGRSGGIPLRRVSHGTQPSPPLDDTSSDSLHVSLVGGINGSSSNGGVTPTTTLQRLLERLRTSLVWYFTYRLRLPHFFLTLIGRSERYLKEREEEEQEEQEAEEEEARLNNGDNTSGSSTSSSSNRHPRTPLERRMHIRYELTTTSLSELVTDLLILIHGIFLITHMVLDDEPNTSQQTLDALQGIIILIEIQYMLEIVTKLVLCGKTFFKNKLQLLDLITILIVWIGQILMFGEHSDTRRQAISCLRFTRAFRLYHRLTSFTLLLQVLSQVGPPLAALFGVLFILLYAYSMFGMMFFCNELILGKPGLDNTDYDASDFYALNFNDLAHSFIALFYQLVVNDWWLLMEAVVARVGDKARIFFLSFYCISVLIVFSVCTAFVVEAYMNLHEAKVAVSAKMKSSLTQLATIPSAAAATSARGSAATSASASVNRGGPAGNSGSNRTAPMLGSSSSSSSAGDTLNSPLLPSFPDDRRLAFKPSRSFRQFHQAVHRASFVGTGSPINIPSSRASTTNIGPSHYAAGGGSGISRSAGDAHTSTSLPTSGGGGGTAASGVASERLLLSRICHRASSMGLKVKLKPTGGMFNTLKSMFGNELDEEEHENEEEDDDVVVEHQDSEEED